VVCRVCPENKCPVTQAESILGLIERRAQATPTAIAVSDGQESLSYEVLYRRARRRATALASFGVKKSEVIGVGQPRTVDLVVTLLAVMMAGCAYLPLEAELPTERLRFMLRDPNVRFVVTSNAGFFEQIMTEGRVISVTELSRETPAAPANSPRPTVCKGDLAYVIYTSGSAGQPKGVEIEHGSLLNVVVHAAWAADIGEEPSVWSMFHSFAFDFSAWEMWACLAHGGRLVMVPYMTARSPGDFAQLLVAEGITVLSITPSAFKQLGPSLRARARELSVRHIIFGGEALIPALLGEWVEDPRFMLVNMYGITEIAIHGTSKVLAAVDASSKVRSPIGRPLAGYTMCVVDAESLQPCPVGVAGELLIGGVGLARGYVNRPELTAERFVQVAVGGTVQRMYRSGDLVRQLPGGEFEYLGRMDRQVKLRGYRIELAEVEAVLAAHPEVRTAVVDLVTAPGEHADQRLAAYIVGARRGGLDQRELAGWCAGRLPRYMVPSAFVEIDEVPLTINGKLDRTRLPTPNTPRTSQTQPRDEREWQVANIWVEVLGIAVPGPGDQFFDLGGDSLSLMRVVARLGKISPNITPRRAYQYLTLAEMAKLL
jgi:amino acid adenylation domain-containing protein